MKLFTRIAEQKLQEAVDRGEFDRLALAGQRIDYQEYVSMPVETRMMYKLMKDAGCLPAELELRKELQALRDQLKRTDLSAETRAKLSKILRVKEIENDLKKEKKRRESL